MSRKRNVNVERAKELAQSEKIKLSNELAKNVSLGNYIDQKDKKSGIIKYRYTAKGKKKPAWYIKPNWRVPMQVGIFTSGSKQTLVGYISKQARNWRAKDKYKFESELFSQIIPDTATSLVLSGKTMRQAVRKINVDVSDRIAFAGKLQIYDKNGEVIRIGFSGVELFDKIYPDQTRLSILQNKIAGLANKSIQSQDYSYTNTKTIPQIYERERKEMEKVFNKYGSSVNDNDKIYQSLARLCILAGYSDYEDVPSSVGLCRQIIEKARADAKELDDKKFLLNLKNLRDHFIDSGVLQLMRNKDVKKVILILEYRHLPKQPKE